MLRYMLLCLLLVAPAAVSAQVFPKIDRDQIERDLATAKNPTTDPVVDVPPEPTVDPKVSTSNCYKKYIEIRAKINGKRSVEKADVTKSIAGMPEVIECYMKAKAFLALGYYKEAGAEAARIPLLPIKDPANVFNPPQEVVITELNNGSAYRLRVVAKLWEDYDDYETEELLKKNWEKAKKEAQKIIAKFDELLASGGINESIGNAQRRGMFNWLENSYTHWKNLWNARRACQERGDEIAVWEALIALSGPDRDCQNDDSPNYLDARAAILAVKDSFADNKRVKDGGMDLLLIRTHLGAFQVEMALKACAVTASTDAGMRALMLACRSSVEKFRDEYLEDLKWK